MANRIQAAALVASLLEGEDPKDFFKRHLLSRAAAAGEKKVAEYDLEDIGIDHNQYFQGRTTYPTNRWDEVYVGVGDNPHEAIEDALDQAGMDGWAVEPISTTTFPETPSVAEEYPDDEESSMQYYAAVWLRAPGEGEAALYGTAQEAEDPKAFLRRMSTNLPHPSSWPKFDRWQKYHHWKPLERRRAFVNYTRQRYTGNRDPEGQAVYEPYQVRSGLRNTRFYRDREKKTHWVEFHNTAILTWDAQGNVRTSNGGYRTITTRDRMNSFLPHGWRIHTYQGEWYWFNHSWPENIRERIYGDQSARRRAEFPYWIDWTEGDTVRADGTLIFGISREPTAKRGLCMTTGALKLEDWPDLRPPPQGPLNYTRRVRRRGYYDPNQLQLNMEGRYMRQLARWKRIKGKHEKMREVTKMQRDLEKVDEPEKKKPKKGHQHLR